MPISNYADNPSVKEETFAEFSKRYSGFGENLYEFLKLNYPRFFCKLTFFRDVVERSPVSYAFYKDERNSFIIQLDPECDVIILWDDIEHIEFGSWDKLDLNRVVLDIDNVMIK